MCHRPEGIVRTGAAFGGVMATFEIAISISLGFTLIYACEEVSCLFAHDPGALP
jgi:hypothetical protein